MYRFAEEIREALLESSLKFNGYDIKRELWLFNALLAVRFPLLNSKPHFGLLLLNIALF